MKASCWRPLDGLPAGEKEKKKNMRSLSLLIMCVCRASDKPTSQDGCEKAERNALAVPSTSKARAADLKLAHVLTHTLQRHTSKVHYLLPPKATNTNSHS